MEGEVLEIIFAGYNFDFFDFPGTRIRINFPILA